MASAHHYGIIDAEVAKELFSYQFVSFWRRYSKYLETQFRNRPALQRQYQHSKELYELWKTELEQS